MPTAVDDALVDVGRGGRGLAVAVGVAEDRARGFVDVLEADGHGDRSSAESPSPSEAVRTTTHTLSPPQISAS